MPLSPRNPVFIPDPDTFYVSCRLHGDSAEIPCPVCARLWPMLKGDELDYRAMLARERFRDWAHLADSRPAAIVEGELASGMTFRREYESVRS